MPFAASLALTLASGWLYGLCFPTASLQLLAWIALVPFLATVRRAGLAGALLLGWVWTITAAYFVGDWFARSIATYYEQPILIGVGFFIGVSSLMAAPFYIAFAACYRVLVRFPRPLVPFLAAAAWAGAELARARLVSGNPWALFGYSQMGMDRLVQIADVTGVYGVSFALVAVNAALVELLVAEGERRHALAGLVAAGALVLALLAYGQLRIAQESQELPGARPVEVAMVQGNLDLGSQWREEFYGRNLEVYLRLTHEVLQKSHPQVVFWPEAALTFFLEDEPLFRDAIARVIVPSGAQLVLGGPREQAASEPIYWNSIFLLSPAGNILGVYDKHRLVPFAERFPLHTVELLRRHFARVREFTPGDSSGPLATAGGPAGVMICNEAMFPEIAGERVRDGAVFFVDPANDTWLTPKFSAQQFDIVRLRTVEQRRYLVRASTSGPSAVVDPAGRVVVRTQFLARTAINGHFYPRTGITTYGRVGDIFAGACLVIAVVAFLVRLQMDRE
jgi:apolipoprotein N-acyltransferase